MKSSIVAAIFCLPIAASAQGFSTIEAATNLGTVIGSEAFCGLTYDHDAIAQWVDENVSADDMSFASTLNMMTMGQEYQNAAMSDSAKAAHCRSIVRVAQSYGFTSE